jgi:putative flippase GtrA
MHMRRRQRELAALRELRDEVWGKNYVPPPAVRAHVRLWRGLNQTAGDKRGFVRFMRFIRFAIVGASGIIVNELALAIFVSGFKLNYVVGSLLATPCSTLWNFALLERWAFRSNSHKNHAWQRWAMLMLINNAANIATIPLLVFCTSVLGINYLISNFFTLVVVILARFAFADWIWSPPRDVQVPSLEA